MFLGGCLERDKKSDSVCLCVCMCSCVNASEDSDIKMFVLLFMQFHMHELHSVDIFCPNRSNIVKNCFGKIPIVSGNQICSLLHINYFGCFCRAPKFIRKHRNSSFVYMCLMQNVRVVSWMGGIPSTIMKIRILQAVAHLWSSDLRCAKTCLG